MMRIPLGILAVLSPLLFPSLFALAIVFGVSLYMPPIALLVGLITDAFYYVPGQVFFPTATVLGLLLAIFSYVVHSFIKARIIGG